MAPQHDNVVPLHRGVAPIPADHLRSIFEPRRYEPLDVPDEQCDPDEEVYAWLDENRARLIKVSGFVCYILAVAVAMYFAFQLGRGAL
jgi:hypothetical protein